MSLVSIGESLLQGVLAPPGIYVSAVYTTVVLLWIACQRWPTGFLQLHYALLCVFSLVSFIGMVYSAWSAASRTGGSWSALMCVPLNDPAATLDSGMKLWMVVFHYSKYYELLDTLIILCRGRPLTFLHVFHHALVILQTHSWITAELSFAWIGVAFNSFVHVFMYYFYYVGASGGRVSWRHRITQLQIVQFVCSLGVYAYFVQLHYTPGVGPCRGWDVSMFSVFFNVSLLLLFIRLARSNARGTGKKSPKDERKNE